MGLTEGVGRALIRDQIPEDRKGTAMGIFHMGVGFMALVGIVSAGLCWDLIGSRAPFVLGGSVAFLAVIVALVVMPKIRRNGVGTKPRSRHEHPDFARVSP
jgi:MFS family permease